MAKKERKYDFGNTNGAELFEEWKNGDSYDERLDEYTRASLDFFQRCVKAVSIEAVIPEEIQFNYSDRTISEMQFAFHSFPCTMNICLTGEDGKVTYLIVISLDLDEQGAPGRYSVYPHRISPDGKVEVYFEEDNTWQTVDPEIISQFRPESRDEAVYGLFRSLESLGVVPVTYMTRQEVQSIISDNEKMLELYRKLKPLAVIISDEQVVSSLIEGLMPVNAYVQHEMVFQVADKLILGCISGVDKDHPGEPQMVAVYATDSVDKMAGILQVLWAPSDETAETYPEVWAGDIISMVPESEDTGSEGSGSDESEQS